ncbi:MAG: hypothetical protein NTY35_15325 [Planctomycetota bacterium]|nr:hypothetical protein [Planctomycetota bacterium]
MKISTSLALLCLASVAGAQTQTKDPIYSKTNPPPSGGPYPPQVLVSTVGGADDCATPDAISGAGAFAVDTTLATNSVGGPAPCATIGKDVWFAWTATSACVTIATCGGSTADTVIAVYSGTTCPPTTQLACSDDACGLQSSVSLSVTPGSVYLIRVGTFGSAGAGWTGTLNITVPSGGTGDDNCATPTALPGPGVYAFDNTAATTGCEGQTEAVCLSFGTTRIVADRWYTYTAAVNGTATVTTCQLLTSTSKDSRVAIYAGSGCPTGAALACNDDDATCTGQTLASTVTWNVTCGQTYTIQVGQYATGAGILVGQFSLAATGTTCGPAGVPYCFGDGTGSACPCANNGTAGNGCANSINPAGGNLATTGAASISADTLSLNGSGMPSSSALYFQGTSQISAAFGDGLRCAGGTVIRLGTKQNSVGGTSSYPVAGDLSVSVRGACAVGDVRTYQCWYRNAAAFCTPSTFNLTNGVAVTWGA